MLDLDAEAGVKLGRRPVPVAMGGVAPIAEQAERPARSRERGFRERGQFIELALRLWRREMALENAPHRVRMPAARHEPPLLRHAELLQMHIADAVLIEPGGKVDVGFMADRLEPCQKPCQP